MELFFSPNSGEVQKKSLHQKFPGIQVEACAHMHTRVKLLEGMQMKTILKLLGPPGFRHPRLQLSNN